MDASTMAWLRPLMWAGAIILFIIGGYSDTATQELWGWGFALLTGGMLDEAPARHEVGRIGLRFSRSGMGPVAQPVFKTGEVW